MFTIRKLSRADFAFAVELANTMDWNMAPEDFEFMNKLEPEGSFLLVNGKEKLGIATAVSYGKVGWFGDLVVKEKTRRRGGGSALVKHSVDFLRGKGVQTVGLYAYPYLADFYRGLGFQIDENFSVLHSEYVKASTGDPVLPRIEKHQVPNICAFDQGCFGGDRTQLLQSILLDEGNIGYQVAENQELIGYIGATVYPKLAWIGPLICQPHRSDVALSLIRATLSRLEGKDAYVVLPQKESALVEAFADAGFEENFSVSRMFLGEAFAKNCIYLAESLERG